MEVVMEVVMEVDLLHKKSFTLLELLIVVVIIGIIAAIGVPSYRKAVWFAQYKEARSMLYLISQAEETYFLEHQAYGPCDESGATRCSDLLHLSLPGQNWVFSVVLPSGGGYCVQAVTTLPGPYPAGYQWRWRFYPEGGDTEPQVGACPS